MDDTPSARAMSAWARMLRLARDLRGRIEAELRAAGLPPLAWYDALLELRRAGPEGLRPFALQEAMLLEQSNLSRLLDRLDRAGLVARAPCPEDGRGQIVRLTEAGAATLERMWPVYRAGLARHFAARLTEAEAAALDDLLGKLRG